MVTKIILIATVLMLAGCTTKESPIIKTTEYVVAMPPAELFKCPVLKKYPNVAKLRDSDVARLINELKSNNDKCAQSLAAVQSWLANAKKTIPGR